MAEWHALSGLFYRYLRALLVCVAGELLPRAENRTTNVLARIGLYKD